MARVDLALMSDYRMGHDSGDPWGSAMGAFFDVAAELYWRGDEIPSEWEYRPGGLSDPRDMDSFFASICAESDSGDLLALGRFLYRYTGILRAAGRDY